MSDMAEPGFARRPEKPPAATLGAIGWLRAHLFNSIPNTILTLLAAFAIVKLVPPFVTWLLIDSKFVAANAKECREVAGACWAFIGEWYRFILFGRFPYAEQWRPLIVIFIFVAMFLASCNRRLWGRTLLAVWIGGAALVMLLMLGGALGLSYVETDLWNGLPLTLILAVFGMLLAFPLAILLALGRRSRMPAVHSFSVAYIELIRGVPLITILFMASVMLPLFLPSGTTINKLLRAQIAIVLFAAAYLAEIIRGGLQAIPKGQYEAADSLGLSYVRKPLYSREGANVAMISETVPFAEREGPYGAEGFIRQAFAPLSKFSGQYPVIGSWLVDHTPCGLSIREDESPITGNSSRFLPHAIL